MKKFLEKHIDFCSLEAAGIMGSLVGVGVTSIMYICLLIARPLFEEKAEEKYINKIVDMDSQIQDLKMCIED